MSQDRDIYSVNSEGLFNYSTWLTLTLVTCILIMWATLWIYYPGGIHLENALELLARTKDRKPLAYMWKAGLNMDKYNKWFAFEDKDRL